ncbi:ABC transporter permease [Streptomyces olivoreticuli]|uniref:ABC transporter permease n=1 Tax=Streptomyces olivoreticuli TaxID=68246 RepID=UPI000E22C86A|nr:ABC transporter permease [Streptomyces olivoreticuli]
MLRTTLRNVLAHKARLLMTALAIMLGVTFVSGILVFSDTVGAAVKNASAKNLKDVAVSVQPSVPSGEAPSRSDEGKNITALDSNLADRIRSLPGVESVRSNVNGTATVVGKDNQPIGNDWHIAANYQPGRDGKDSRYPVKEGRGPAASDEIALEAKTAATGGHKIGGTVRFATDGPVITKKLVGIVGTEDPRVTAGGSLALFDTATAQELFLSPGQFDEFLVAAEPGSNDQALTSKVGEILPKDRAKATSGTQLAAEQSQMIAEDNKALSKTLLVFAGIAQFVSVFIIANTFTMLIAQRRREIALMRTLGASRRQVVRSVLAEAALLGLASSAVGFLLGLGIARGVLAVLGANGPGFPDGPLVISPTAVLSALTVGVLVTVLSAWLPSRKAAKIAPIEALNSADQTPAPSGLTVRNSIGTAITMLGVAIMLYVSTLRNESGVSTAMLGSAVTVTGMIILAPLLSRPLVTLAGKVTTHLFGVSGKLAKENALRNPRRTAATASALMVGLTLITAVTVAMTGSQQLMELRSTQDLTADYQITSSSSGGLSSKTARKAAQVPGVQSAVPVQSTGFAIGHDHATMKGIDPAALRHVTDLLLLAGSLNDVEAGSFAISDKTAKRFGWKMGDTVPVDFNTGSKERLKVSAVYKNNDIVSDAFTVPQVISDHTRGEDRANKILVKAQDGKAAGLSDKIRSHLDNNPLLKIQDHNELRKEAAGPITTILYLLYGLLGMSVAIAAIGVVNTLAMSVFERTREIGMLRAIGMERTGIKQMIRLESLVISLFGAMTGIGLGLFLSWTSGQMLHGAFPGYEMSIPWRSVGLFLLLSLAVGILAAAWPARRAAQLNTLQSIGDQ